MSVEKAKKKKHGYVSITLFLRGRRFIDELFTRYNVVSFNDISEWLCNLMYPVLSDIGKLNRIKGVV